MILFFLPHLAAHVAKSLFLGTLVVELRQNIKYKVRIAYDADDDREFVIGNREFECSAVDLDDISASSRRSPASFER